MFWTRRNILHSTQQWANVNTPCNTWQLRCRFRSVFKCNTFAPDIRVNLSGSQAAPTPAKQHTFQGCRHGQTNAFAAVYSYIVYTIVFMVSNVRLIHTHASQNSLTRLGTLWTARRMNAPKLARILRIVFFCYFLYFFSIYSEFYNVWGFFICVVVCEISVSNAHRRSS